MSDATTKTTLVLELLHMKTENYEQNLYVLEQFIKSKAIIFGL